MSVSEKAKAAQRKHYANISPTANKLIPVIAVIKDTSGVSICLEIEQDDSAKVYAFSKHHIFVQSKDQEILPENAKDYPVTGDLEQFRDEKKNRSEVVAWIPVWLMDHRGIDKSLSLLDNANKKQNGVSIE